MTSQSQQGHTEWHEHFIRKVSDCYPFWSGIRVHLKSRQIWSWAQLRASNLQEAWVCVCVCFKIRSVGTARPVSAQMTGEWSRPQGGLNVMALAEPLQSSDSLTRHRAAQQPRKKKIKTRPTNTHRGKLPPTSDPKTQQLLPPGWNRWQHHTRELRGKNRHRAIKKNQWLEGHG